MHPDRWKLIEDVYHAAQDRNGPERTAFLDNVCANDGSLRREIESLLDADDGETFLDKPVAAEAAPMLLEDSPETSRLAPGTKLGPYEILSSIASGGMGEVYRARDTRLQRNVAIKILPRRQAESPDFRESLEREARTISNLNHPNICTLYDIGRQDEVDYLVMEYLEGETLAERLSRGRLPVKDTLQVAIQMADALDKAHRQGVVHRDVKPGNIMLTKSGAKLLDFGVARQMQPRLMASTGPNSSSTNTDPAERVVVGTLPYMAPEQIDGAEGDARTDIFALGSVIYEMCTGRTTFGVDNQASLIGPASEANAPSISSLQPAAPPLLDHTVRICLARNPDDRWQTMADVFIQLRLIAQVDNPIPTATVKPFAKLRWAAVAALVAMAIVAIVLMIPARTPDARRISFEIPTPSAPAPYHISLSPTGSHVAAIVTSNEGENVVWVRALERLNAQILSGTSGAAFPFWSPDGRFIGFFAQGELKKVDLLGAPPQTLCAAAAGRGGTWNKNGVIIFAPSASGPLSRVSASGGVASPLTALDRSREETAHRHPQFLPDGDHFLYLAVSNKPQNSGIYVASLRSPGRKFLVGTTLKAVFAAPDHILYLRDGALVAQSFDPVSLTLKGEPLHISDDVGTNLGNSSAAFTLSDNGVLAYRSGGSEGNSYLTWFDRTGREIGSIEPPASYESPVLSPDLQRIAVGKSERPTSAIWILDLIRGPLTRLTFTSHRDSAPTWSPDGTRLVYASNQGGTVPDLYIKRSDGAGKEELLFKSDHPKLPEHWSADGRFLLFREEDPQSLSDLWILPMTGEKTPEPFVRSQFRDMQGRFSPDTRWIAYVSNESGRDEIYVQGFPAGGTKTQISANSGYQPRWRRDGKELFFITGTREVMSVAIDVSEAGELRPDVPQKLFGINPIFLVTHRNTWDVTPDGQRFLINSSLTAPAVMPITIVVNWLDAGKNTYQNASGS